MSGDGSGLVVQVVPIVSKSFAKVNILEPDRAKSFVKSTQFLPDFAAKHQERSGGLFYLSRCVVVKVIATGVPVRRVALPEPVNEQRLEREDRRGWQPANVKTRLDRVNG